MTSAALGEVLSTKRLLIFDFDGTLVDSSPLHARAFDEAFARWLPSVDYSAIAGITTEAAVAKVVDMYGLSLSPAEQTEVIGAKRARARQLLGDELAAVDGAVDFVRRARSRFPLALCTSGSRPTVLHGLDRVGLGGIFDPIVAAGEAASKPDPDGFLRAATAHGVTPAEALVFEDSDNGLLAAERAGMGAICITTSRAESGPPCTALAATDWASLSAALEGLAS